MITKKLRSCVAIICVLVLLGTIAVGCGKAGKDSKDGSTTMVDTSTTTDSARNVSIKVMTGTFKYDPRETIVQKQWLENVNKSLNVNLNIEYDLVPFGNYGDKMKLQFASNDIPDIMLSIDNGLTTTYGNQGMLYDIKPILNTLENYNSFVQGTNGQEKAIATKEGKIFAFYDGSENSKICTQGIWMYRSDILAKHNLAVPQTLDELTAVCKALKAAYPDAYPIGAYEGGGWDSIVSRMLLINKVSDGIDWDGKQFVFDPTTENYKETLMYLNSLYKQKLLDPQCFINNDDQFKSKLFSGKIFIVPNEWGSDVIDFNNNKDVKIEVAAALSPKNPKYGEPYVPFINIPGKGLNTWAGLVISSESKEKEFCAKLLDYQYSDESIELINWGIENKSYTKGEDGQNYYLPEILAADDARDQLAKMGVMSAMDCRPGIVMNPQFMAAQYQLVPKTKYLTRDNKLTFEDSFYGATEKELTAANQNPNDARPITQFTKDQLDFETNNMTPIYTYRDDCKIKFIMGKMSFDQWDEYVAQINKLGDLKQVLKNYNDAANAQ